MQTQMARVVVIGTSCAGKPTLARSLANALTVVLWRVLTRTVRRVLTREELFSGNRESLRMAFFSRESVIMVGHHHLSCASKAVPTII
jgi:ribose 1,5-bisphosphokinase PhnN